MSDLKNKIAIIGIGQCGSQIARQFDLLNYNTFYINSSIADFPDGIEDDTKFLINGAKGCAKDRQKAIDYGVGSFDEILDRVDARYPLSSIFYVIYAGGGGTGSGLTPILLDIASSKNPNKKYNAVMVLPHDDESLLAHDNAKESLKQITDIQDKLYSIHLLSNNKRKDFLDINKEFSMLLDGIIDHKSHSEKGNIDDEETEQLITDTGFSVMLEFEDDDFKVGLAKSIKDSIYADWNNDSRYLGMILNDYHDKNEVIKVVENEFGIPLTDFTTFNGESNKIIATGISFNKAILRNINDNIKEKMQKKQVIRDQKGIQDEEIEEVNLSSLMTKKKPVKKNSNANVMKDLDSILNKYKKK
jgi:cell division GTPase FtsZ